MAPVNRPSGWVFHSLWKHQATERCRVCIPDTILVSEGAPVRWLFTSRNGEVVRKRVIDIKSVRERFVKIGLLDINDLQVNRRYVVVAFFILAAILTPPDPLSQLMIALPLIFLYEITLIIIRMLNSKK
mgnify:CR=1 FL=1